MKLFSYSLDKIRRMNIGLNKFEKLIGDGMVVNLAFEGVSYACVVEY